MTLHDHEAKERSDATLEWLDGELAARRALSGCWAPAKRGEHLLYLRPMGGDEYLDGREIKTHPLSPEQQAELYLRMTKL